MPCFPTEIYSLTGSVAAAAFVPSPALTLIAGDDAKQTWQVPYELLGGMLISSLLNFSTTQIMGVFLIAGQTPATLSYSKTLSAIAGSITRQNSLTGPPAVPIPTNKTTPFILPQPLLIPPNTPIGLYTFGDTTALNQLDAYVSLIMRQKA